MADHVCPSLEFKTSPQGPVSAPPPPWKCFKRCLIRPPTPSRREVRCSCKGRRNQPRMGRTINKALGPGCPAAGSANRGPTAHTALIPMTGAEEETSGHRGAPPQPPSVPRLGLRSICRLLLTDHLLELPKCPCYHDDRGLDWRWQHKHSRLRFHFYLCSGMGLGGVRLPPSLRPPPSVLPRLWPGLPPTPHLVRSSYSWELTSLRAGWR